ncbi:MBL fold metallo-hydrolase [Clostridium magnum]|uniref:Putative hydrolase n=1 Tax=Clostridium magnum DSM 2767 TaxID=1121326 RepID=A0A165S064_9CLOT|nr:MBL fold metallo-hydrolase [Clostridium magnum]KZL91433.1 putative hydrolase [Clostridium magnum DSM 2767]SHH42137.1 7,8-dihydropterin-6-yl-methyl-4-(beta-D-ribofuranosyl)aminobenzene 5'-phosphate synthase [Clostridium magnum DSM 2767]
MSLKITTLIENSQGDNKELINEHGLSLYIEVDEVKILFDTGKSGDFIKNAERLKVDLSRLDYVILSHGHYDHSGGFEKLVGKIGSSFKLIVGEKFFNAKHKLLGKDRYKYNGNPFEEEFIKLNSIPIKYINEDIFSINEDIMIFSNIERKNSFEKLNENFFVKQVDEYNIDTFLDEIVLAIKLNGYLFVVLGCSHVGLVNILETILKRTNMPIYGIFGGTHLIEADELRLNSTINFLTDKQIRILGMSHCTGENAVKEFKEKFKGSFIHNNTGNIINVK